MMDSSANGRIETWANPDVYAHDEHSTITIFIFFPGKWTKDRFDQVRKRIPFFS